MNSLPEDFSNYPQSVADIKSDRSGSSVDWAPRDVLINMLREIDSGRLRTDLVCVCYRKLHDDGTKPTTSFSVSSKDGHATQGVIHTVLAYLTNLAIGLTAMMMSLSFVEFFAEMPL